MDLHDACFVENYVVTLESQTNILKNLPTQVEYSNINTCRKSSSKALHVVLVRIQA